MSRDDVDNRIRSASAGYVTANGHLLYVYDSTTGMTDGSAAFETDSASLEDEPRPRVTRMDNLTDGVGSISGDGVAPTDDDDIYDSFTALFLAYDAADSDNYPAFDDEPDDNELDDGFGVDEANAIASAWRRSRNDSPSGDDEDDWGSLPSGADADDVAYDPWDDEDRSADDAADLAAMNALMDALDLAEEGQSFDDVAPQVAHGAPAARDDRASFDGEPSPAFPEASDGGSRPSGVKTSATFAGAAQDADDLAAMNAIMDSFAAAEGAPTVTASARADAAAVRRRASAPSAQPSVRGDAAPRHGRAGATRSHAATRGTVAVSDMAARSPEAQAAVAALGARRAQARRRHGAYAFIAVGVVMVAALSLFVNYLLGLDETVAATAGGMAAAVREDYALTVSAAGLVEPVDTFEVVPYLSGTVGTLYVAEGDLVEEGNVLFTVKNEGVSQAIDEAGARLDEANDELSRANAAVIAAYNAYNDAVDRYRGGTNPSFDEDALLAAIDDAETRRDEAYERADEARVDLEDANDAAVDADVTAPIDGAVVDLKVREGARVRGDADDEGDVALSIADVSSMHVEVYLDASQLEGVYEGQEARIALAALPDIACDAEVASIDSEPNRQGAYAVDLFIAEPDNRIRPGSDVVATITTDVERDVVVVPESAVVGEGDDASVWVVTDADTGKSERRQVRVGRHDGARAVIVEGLEEGELVGLPA